MFTILDGRKQFYQWDKNRKLIVEDSTIKQVHFCNKTDNCSLVCETYIEDGKTLVDVPNELLQTDWRINVYAYDGSATKHSATFGIIGRTKPADYLYTETDILNYENVLQIANDAKELAEKAGIVASEQGGIINTEVAIEAPLNGLRVFGRSVQYDTPTPTTPVAITNVESAAITICKQNLLPNREAGESHLKNGVTYTHEADRVYFKGVSTKDTWETINYLFLPAGTYRLGQDKNGTTTDANFIALIYKIDEVNTDFSANASNDTDTFTLTETRKIRFCINVKKGASVDGSILPQIRYVPAKYSGKMEAYEGNKYAVVNRTLRGLEYKYTQHTPTYTDTNGKQWYCDEIDFTRGVYIQRVNAVTLSVKKEDVKTDTQGMLYFEISVDDIIDDFATTAMCNKAKYYSEYKLGNFIYNRTLHVYRFYAVKGATAEQLANAYNGATLYYPCEPIETPLTHDEMQTFANMRMEKDFTNMYINANTEFVAYFAADAVKYIDYRLQQLTAAISSLGGNV